MRAFLVTVAGAEEDSATAALWEAGTAGIEIRPAPEDPSSLHLLAYFPDGVAERRLLAGLRAAIPKARVKPFDVPDVDWVGRFRAHFRAFRVGRFVVAPPWDEGPDSEDRLLVDPGRAFGTGTHETTRLCLRALEDLARRRPLGRTLDLGAGTGLLAVAAARLGASPVVASDIDPDATSASRTHARVNHARLHVVRSDGGTAFRPGCFDLVLANLTVLLLVDRADEIRALLAPGGALVASGLLQGDREEVRSAFADLGRPRELVEGEWAALVYERTRR